MKEGIELETVTPNVQKNLSQLRNLIIHHGVSGIKAEVILRTLATNQEWLKTKDGFEIYRMIHGGTNEFTSTEETQKQYEAFVRALPKTWDACLLLWVRNLDNMSQSRIALVAYALHLIDMKSGAAKFLYLLLKDKLKGSSWWNLLVLLEEAKTKKQKMKAYKTFVNVTI